MNDSAAIAAALLEDDVEDRAESDPPFKLPPGPEEDDPKEEVMRIFGEINAELLAKEVAGIIDAKTAPQVGSYYDSKGKWHYSKDLFHKYYLNVDGTALRARVNGAVKTWVTRPDEFRIPFKHGFKTYGYINQDNAHEWTTVEPAPIPAKVMRERRRRMGRQTWNDRRYKPG